MAATDGPGFAKVSRIVIGGRMFGLEPRTHTGGRNVRGASAMIGRCIIDPNIRFVYSRLGKRLDSGKANRLPLRQTQRAQALSGLGASTVETAGERKCPASSLRSSQAAQPHFEDGSVYRQNRPTKLDKIKNLHAKVQADAVGGPSDRSRLLPFRGYLSMNVISDSFTSSSVGVAPTESLTPVELVTDSTRWAVLVESTTTSTGKTSTASSSLTRTS